MGSIVTALLYLLLTSQLTITLRCSPIPASIGHAGYCCSIVSLCRWGEAVITGVGHYGANGGTGATA